ncbi:MAG: methyl-accepting chemotaxis protein [Phycisphaerales bacterium]
MLRNARAGNRFTLSVLAAAVAGGVAASVCLAATPKPGPDAAIAILKDGNARFVAGQSSHPHSDNARLEQAGTENQGDYAYATVITCSDSRVPVERVFDAGVMDIFVIRVAGNVCDTDEIGSIEYGLAHVRTPVLVVLGHTQCGAVTAVTHAIHGTGHALERNIPPLVNNIEPAVRRAMERHSDVQGDAIVPFAIEENVWQGIEDLFLASPATRDLVKSGQVKVVGAIYDVGTGKVQWLPEQNTLDILHRVESTPARAMNAMADEHGAHASADASHGEQSTQSLAVHPASSHGAAETVPGPDSHGTAEASASHEASAADQAAVALILRTLESQKQVVQQNEKEVTRAGWGNKPFYGLAGAVVLLALGLALFYSRTKDEQGHSAMRLTLGSKLVGGFGLVLVLLTIVAVYSLIAMGGIGREINELAEESVPLTDRISTIETCQLQQEIALERAFRFGEENTAEAKTLFTQQTERFDQLAKQVDKELEDAAKFVEDRPADTEVVAKELSEVAANLGAIGAEHKTFDALADKVLQLLGEGKGVQARLLEGTIEEASQKLDAEIERFTAKMQSRAEESGKLAEADEKKAGGIMIIISMITVALGFVMAVMLTRSIVNPVQRIIASLTEGAEQVAAASGQVSAASQSLAEGATEQAAGLEETSSSLEEMSSMTKQNADNAQQANTLAGDAKKAAGTGAESMGRMNAAIHEIQKSSDETAKIIKVIDEIAFQTNLLALNAAVEAARAGEAGKGFAVVAEEVRNLAMRSAEAAKNTASMIEESVKNSKNGVDIATEVGKVLGEIVQSVGKTTDLVSEIAAASQEQAQGIDQVNTAVSQMDKVTQQNAANAEESASASEELNAQAESMKEVVSQLVVLVGGANTDAAHSGGAKTERHHIHLNLEHKLHPTEKPKSKARAFGKSDEVLHKIAVHSDKPQHVAGTKPAGKAIPLDDHENDLHEFNS